MPRMTNTYMLAGDATRPRSSLGQARPLRHQLRRRPGRHHQRQVRLLASEAYLIENGKIQYPVKGATLIGNGPEALTRVSMIGNDLASSIGRRHLRQGRPERAGRRRPADPAHRRGAA
jgi:TldD protein